MWPFVSGFLNLEHIFQSLFTFCIFYIFFKVYSYFAYFTPIWIAIVKRKISKCWKCEKTKHFILAGGNKK